MNINRYSWYHGYGYGFQEQSCYEPLTQLPPGYIEQTAFGRVISFTTIPQQRIHHTMAGSTSDYINIRNEETNQNPTNECHHQQQMSNNHGIINGLKNIVNGFINPNLNCNPYTEHHHRNYNPKYREEIDNNANNQEHPQQCKSEPHVQTVLLNLSVEPKIISTQTTTSTVKLPIKLKESTTIDEVDHCHRSTGKCDNIGIFTLDDFPELPVPKQKGNFNFWNEQEKTKKSCLLYDLKGKINNCKNKKNKMKENIKENKKSAVNITMKPPTIEDDDDSSDSSFNDGGCSSTGLSNNFSTNTVNVQEIESDSDSEDNFIIFTNQSPSKYETIINCNSNNTKVKTSCPTSFRSKIRERQISECSDDSFIICFTDDAAEGVIEFSDGISSSDDDDDDDETDYETDDDEINDEANLKMNENEVVNNKKINSNKQKTENNINNTNDDDTPSKNDSQLDSGFHEHKGKKVRFNLNLEVHTMCTWNFAYRAARKGHWENYVRDRSRFGDRIKRLSSILNPMLHSKHRENIYKLRFCDNNDTIS